MEPLRQRFYHNDDSTQGRIHYGAHGGTCHCAPSTSNASNNTIDISDLPWDPSERPNIITYNPNQRDEIRRKYLVRGPCQPRGHKFPTKLIGAKPRRFVPSWFDEYQWLEYSVKVDKAYCLPCYLFRDPSGTDAAFVTEGFNSWSKKKRFKLHEGGVKSNHHKALAKCEDLLNQNQSIAAALLKQSELAKTEYHMRLTASVEVCRFLLENALPFRGNDESESSLYKGLFLGTLKLVGKINVILQNALKNNQMTSPIIQKDIVTCFTKEVLKSIMGKLGNDVFALLVDESRDVSRKEQMVVVLRFVDKNGVVQERFIGVVHVMDTSALNLKATLDALFAKHGLSFTKVRGQGYDGASNMSGRFNKLKALILSDNESAFYVHCFAHLQLVVVAVSKKHDGVRDFFDLLALVVTMVNSSCKRKYMLRESHKDRIQEQIGNKEIVTGKGLNQEISLIRAEDTRWNSHLKIITSLIALFLDVIKVFEYVEDDGDNGATRLQASELTNSLSQALQRKDQDILEAVDLIRATKGQLQMLRENGFDQVLEKCYYFCDKHKIAKLDMAEGLKSKKKTNISNRHYYNYDIFNTVFDMQIREFGDRFCEISTELLQNMAALNLRNSFSQFNKASLLKLSHMYPRYFDAKERIILEHELDIYYHSIYKDIRFANLSIIADLARLMLTLVLPIATATVKRCFSAIKLVKTDLHNRNADDFLNVALICAIEKEAHDNVKNEDVTIVSKR
ncbi:hypothetical protein OSB04_031990 [Centaurea solstitialis]|uniref:TTF-type domain-containing protein n=1 Tax=Centaurea solstitialis TaxID=347529 RepID=A0AA38VUX7_9ASTR|nr:hypothetical protein OSB04_031990 [Centaurea solstitialis]